MGPYFIWRYKRPNKEPSLRIPESGHAAFGNSLTLTYGLCCGFLKIKAAWCNKNPLPPAVDTVSNVAREP